MSRPGFLADHDFNGQIVSGILRQEPGITLSRLLDWGLQQSPDPDVLEFAADRSLIVISHDANTMTAAAKMRITSREPMSGLIIAPQRLSPRVAIDDVILIWAATDPDEWTDRIEFLPV